MKAQEVTVTNETGLHARPASVFVNAASKFKSDIIIKKGEKQGNAKSVLAVLAMGITKGSEITITAQGPDEEEAVNALVELINSRLGEK